MDVTNREVVERAFEAFNRDGPQGYVDYLVEADKAHPEFTTYMQPDLPTGGTYEGVDAYLKVAGDWFESFDSFAAVPVEYVVADPDRFLIVCDQRAVAKVSGLELSAFFYYVVVFDGGRVRELHIYADRAGAERALRR